MCLGLLPACVPVGAAAGGHRKTSGAAEGPSLLLKTGLASRAGLRVAMKPSLLGPLSIRSFLQALDPLQLKASALVS